MECNYENKCGCTKYKSTPRDEHELKLLKNRLSRIMGQLGGIQKMLDESALQSVGYIILQDHMKTCMAEEIRQGSTEVIDEAVELIKKLK